MKTSLPLLALLGCGAFSVGAQPVLVAGGSPGGALTPAVAPGMPAYQAPAGQSGPVVYQAPAAYAVPTVQVVSGGYYSAPNVIYFGGPNSCYWSSYPSCYYRPGCSYSPNVFYFGRGEACERGYRFRHYR